MLRILIVDDHPVFRRGLKQIIEDAADMLVVAEAENGREAISIAQTSGCDLVLLDISIPVRNGLDVLSELKARNPGLPILVLSMHPEEQYAVRALKTGASGYLTKESAPEELVAAIRKVSSGGKYVSASLAEYLAVLVQTESSLLPHEQLSQREYQVMSLIGSGKTVSEIALELSLSVKTVSTYRGRVLKKLAMKNNAQVMRYVANNLTL
jgi:two-component system invasion response regulator UvrY